MGKTKREWLREPSKMNKPSGKQRKAQKTHADAMKTPGTAHQGKSWMQCPLCRKLYP